MIRNWKDMSDKQKQKMLTLAMFLAAALLIVAALIIGIVSCAGKREAEPAEAAQMPIPVLLQAKWDTRSDAQAEAVRQPDGETETLPEIDSAEATPDAEDNAGEPEGTAEHKYETLKKHDKGDAVTTLQNRLMELGYLEIEEPTDYFGNSTEYAVSLFQRQHELKQDGIAGEQTQTLLFSKDAKHYAMLEGAEGRDVKMLQEQLVELGYLSSSDVDRIYGEKTVEAVKAFQKRNGLTQDGKAGEKTLDKLFSDDAKMTKAREDQIKAEQKAESAKVKATPKPTKSSSKTTKKPDSKTTPKATKKPTATPKQDTKLEKFIKAANSKIGCEYVLGDSGPKTFDCSGFVTWCLRQAGVSTSRLNAEGFSKVSRWKNITKMSDLKKGDLLFFKSDSSSRVSHTGIYIGGNTMIDASSSNGKVVKRALSSYFKRNFVNARRPWE
jgi:cell wall-associated NlpC family hydrolase